MLQGIPRFAELGLSGLGNSFKVTQADSIASGLYAGSYNKNQTVPDPNCVENGGVSSWTKMQIFVWRKVQHSQ